MWKTKLLKQTGVCLIIAAAFAVAHNADIPQLNRGSEAVVAYLSKNYTVSDVMTFAKDSAAAVVRTPVTITNAVLSSREESKYAQPIDEAGEGETVTVRAAAAGTVSAVGENDKIGKFVKITHGDESESVYGNCQSIRVKELERVKRGQAIGTFKKEGDTEFYYNLSKFEEN